MFTTFHLADLSLGFGDGRVVGVREVDELLIDESSGRVEEGRGRARTLLLEDAFNDGSFDHLDLAEGFDLWTRKSVKHTLRSVQHWICGNADKNSSLKQLVHEAHIVTTADALATMAKTPCSVGKSWTFVAERVGDVIFLCEKCHDSGRNWTEDEWMALYMLLKFEQTITSDSQGEQQPLPVPKTQRVLTGRLFHEGRRLDLLYTTNMDFRKPNGDPVGIKLRHKLDLGRTFWQHEAIKWYLQMLFGAVDELVVGYQDRDSGILKSVEVMKLAELGEGVNDMWNVQQCHDFLGQVLTHLCEFMEDPLSEKVVVEFRPNSGEVTFLVVNGRASFLLPELRHKFGDVDVDCETIFVNELDFSGKANLVDLKRLDAFTEDENGGLHFGTSALKRLYQPLIGRDGLSIDLYFGYEQWMNDVPAEIRTLDVMQRWLCTQVTGDRRVSLKKVAKGADVIASRGVLTALAGTTYERRPWQFVLERVDGVLLLSEIIDVEKQFTRQSVEFVKAYYAVRKLAQVVTVGPEANHPNLLQPVNDFERPKGIVSARLGSHGVDIKILFSAEFDAINEGGDWVEVKSQKGAFNNNFWRHKSVKWYLQSAIAGMQNIVVGYRDAFGQLNKVESIATSSLESSPESPWQPEHCYNVLAAILGRVINFMKETSHSRFLVLHRPNLEEIHMAPLLNGQKDILLSEFRAKFL